MKVKGKRIINTDEAAEFANSIAWAVHYITSTVY